MPFILEEEDQKETIPSPNKKRLILEDDTSSSLKRKSKIALGEFAEGISDPISLLMSIVQPGADIKTQKNKIKTIFETLGVDTPEAETKAEEYIAKISRGIGSGALFGPIAAATGGATAAIGQGLKDVGVPEGIANITEGALGFLAPSGISKTAKIKPGFEKTAKVIEKEGLPPVKGILSKPFHKITPVTSESSLKNFERKIERSVQESSEKILEQSLLGKKLEKQGTIIGDLIEDAYKQSRDIGKTINKSADLSRASAIIGRQADKIEKSAPSLASPTEEIVKKLRKYQKDFSGSRVSPDQFQNQWIEINKDLSNLYRKPELTGAEKLLKSSLEDTKKVLLSEASSQFKNPVYINTFKQANKLYSEAAKLDRVNALFEPVFDKGFNPNRFRSLFHNPKKYHELSQSIGEANAKRLNDISKYYVDPIEKMKKAFKVKNIVDLEDLVGSGAVAKIIGFPAAVAKFALVDLPPRIQAKLMMNENTQSIWLRLMKSIQHGSPKLIQKYVEELQGDLESGD